MGLIEILQYLHNFRSDSPYGLRNYISYFFRYLPNSWGQFFKGTLCQKIGRDTPDHLSLQKHGPLVPCNNHVHRFRRGQHLFASLGPCDALKSVTVIFVIENCTHGTFRLVVSVSVHEIDNLWVKHRVQRKLIEDNVFDASNPIPRGTQR